MANQLLGLIGSEIVGWIVAGVLALVFGGSLKLWWPRYKNMKGRIETLEARGATTVIHNHVPVTGDPPALGDINKIKVMSSSKPSTMLSR